MFNLCTIQIMFKFRHVQLPFHKFNLRYYTTKYCLMLEIHRQTKPLMVTINMVFSCLVYFVCLAGYLLTSYTAKQYPALAGFESQDSVPYIFRHFTFDKTWVCQTAHSQLSTDVAASRSCNKVHDIYSTEVSETEFDQKAPESSKSTTPSVVLNNFTNTLLPVPRCSRSKTDKQMTKHDLQGEVTKRKEGQFLQTSVPASIGWKQSISRSFCRCSARPPMTATRVLSVSVSHGWWDDGIMALLACWASRRRRLTTQPHLL